VVLTPQYTNEEYENIFLSLKAILGTLPKVYIWRDANEKMDSFDGILLRGDLNSNTHGLNQVLERYSINAVVLRGDFELLASQNASLTLVFGPEIEKSYPHFSNEVTRFAELSNVVYFGTTIHPITKKFTLAIPTKVFAEKNGTFVNFNGLAQKLKANPPVFPAMLGLEDIFSEMKV
jgi:NADH-quinone oxidoreductase subunit G